MNDLEAWEVDIVEARTPSFRDAQKITAAKSEALANYRQRAAAFFGPFVFNARGRPYFWDMPRSERAAFYAQYPPILVDGTVPGIAPFVGPPTVDAMGNVMPGELQMPPNIAPQPNWLWMQHSEPAEYDRHLTEYGEILAAELKRL